MKASWVLRVGMCLADCGALCCFGSAGCGLGVATVGLVGLVVVVVAAAAGAFLRLQGIPAVNGEPGQAGGIRDLLS